MRLDCNGCKIGTVHDRVARFRGPGDNHLGPFEMKRWNVVVLPLPWVGFRSVWHTQLCRGLQTNSGTRQLAVLLVLYTAYRLQKPGASLPSCSRTSRDAFSNVCELAPWQQRARWAVCTAQRDLPSAASPTLAAKSQLKPKIELCCSNPSIS